MSDAAADSPPVAIPELVQLGVRLSQARQARGLSLNELADRLHIGPDQLDALERGDRSRLKEPVFVIALAKRLAGTLAIDIDAQVVDLRQSRFMQPAAAAPTAPTSRPVGQRPSVAAVFGTSTRRRPFFRIGRRPSVLLAGGLALVAAFALISTLRLPRQQRPSPARSAAIPAGPAEPGRETRPDPLRPATTARPATIPRPTGSRQTSPEVASGAGAVDLALSSTQPSWLEVRDQGGATLFRGTLNGEKRFPLGQGLEVLSGRPDLVSVTSGNQPPTRLGSISQVQWRSFKPAP